MDKSQLEYALLFESFVMAHSAESSDKALSTVDVRQINFRCMIEPDEFDKDRLRESCAAYIRAFNYLYPPIIIHNNFVGKVWQDRESLAMRLGWFNLLICEVYFSDPIFRDRKQENLARSVGNQST